MTPRCRYDRERELYLSDGEPCKTDDYGDPTHHCKARRSCGNHIGRGELTCARCIGRTRADVRRIASIAPLMLTQALGSGVNSEAADLAAPASDPRGWASRRIAMRTYLLTWDALGRITERQYIHARATMEDDDEWHPYNVLTRWQLMLSEDYGHPLPDRMTITGAAGYLERNLGRIAQDPEQDWPLLAREIGHCRDHLEVVIRNGRDGEKGAPCPDCKDAGHVVRLVREYGHWCEDPLCERFHFADDRDDRWVCPRDREHWRSHEDYQRWIEERTGA